MKNDRGFVGSIGRRRATTMRIPFEGEFSRAPLAPRQAKSRGGHNHQRHRLLPVHLPQDNPKPRARNREFAGAFKIPIWKLEWHNVGCPRRWKWMTLNSRETTKPSWR